MPAYPVQTAEQLKPLLAAFRKSAGLTQEALAARLGVTQQTYSAAERNAGQMSAAKLLTVLHALGVELVLQPRPAPGTKGPHVAEPSPW